MVLGPDEVKEEKESLKGSSKRKGSVDRDMKSKIARSMSAALETKCSNHKSRLRALKNGHCSKIKLKVWAWTAVRKPWVLSWT